MGIRIPDKRLLFDSWSAGLSIVDQNSIAMEERL